MAEVREVAMVLIVMVAWAWQPVHPHPTHDSLPSTKQPVQQEDHTNEDPGDNWTLWDTVLRVDQLLQRPNDYNALMLESGEHDDELSRLLYKRQEWQRQQERMPAHTMAKNSGTPELNTAVDNNIQMIREVRYIDPRRTVFWV